MKNQILLIDDSKNEINTVADKYILRFDSGANISFEFKVTSMECNLVCRSWYGESEWTPSLEISCHIVVNPYAGCCIVNL